MIEATPPHRAARLALLLLFAWAGWRVLSLGMADHWAVSDPERALWWRPDHPRAEVRLAGQWAASGKDPAGAAALAQSALRGNPLEGRAYRVLGLLADARGDVVEAQRQFESAARLAPRDIPTHMWLLRRYLQLKRPDAAMRQIDLTLRVEPALFEVQYPLLQSLATFAPTRDAVVAMLATDPPWRSRFLIALCQRNSDAAAVAPAMASLAKTGEGWRNQEANAWIDRLVRDHAWDQAYAAWRDWLPAADRPAAPGIYNGGFEGEPASVGFGWRFLPVDGATIDRDPVEGAEGRVALHISFDNRRVPFSHVRQLLRLAPGGYRIAGRRMLDDLRNDRGLQWRVTCAEGGAALGESERWSGSSAWRPFTFEFTVPPTGCGAQWLTLRLAARIPAEQLAGGDAWFDDLVVETHADPQGD